ncbi:MAG: HsdR family type I site-specific deoxyribonuclease [Actinobacteria bacterium]|nr:HsdR family type I site-specific deoxyribonuclease [Actinomycetota bacterium]
MQTPSFKEDHISQIPALQFLVKLGYEYLTPAEALKLRGDKTSAVLLEPILRRQLEKLNAIEYRSRRYAFSANNIQAGIQALKEVPVQEGYIYASEYVYDLLTLGKALEQSIEGDKKSWTLRYIDWERRENNVFHVTEEFSVLRSKSNEHYRPDIVLFVNGIPFVVMECKRPDIKEPIEQAISQQLRNQQQDGIRSLYVYSQILLALAANDARYATTGTEEKFWALWRELFPEKKKEAVYRNEIRHIKNRPAAPGAMAKLFDERFQYVKAWFYKLEQEEQKSTIQDEYLYNLCRPARLLDLTHNFILYDDGVKKIARYQQFFAVKETLSRITSIDKGRRNGGVIWHTQGSGKSLTMVLLAQAIALEKSIRNPKIILVTDRVDLDDQIYDIFKKCGKLVHRARTGAHLIELLQSKSDAIITTVINKFEAAVKRTKKPFTSPDIFVLVDEGHRSQYGAFHINMQRVFENGCFVAFTGTPLMKREKNTALKFGGIIQPAYTITTAVADKAVVPLLYEGRHALQKVQSNVIDVYFNKIAEPLGDYQKTDLKRKFSRADQLNIADQKIYCIAWDISKHFEENWQGTGFKGQLVCQNKATAIKYKNYLDEIGLVGTAVLISPPDQREGSDSAYEKPGDIVLQFWDRMMQEHGTPAKYEKNIINRFKHQENPEIIIVVDKLLTGFDAPRNVVLYLTRSLKEHSLLQAIARVNRIHPGKSYGYIIDYYGILGELDQALTDYSSLENFDQEDLIGVIENIDNEIKKLPQIHSELWDIFKTIDNKYDEAAYEELLRDEERRTFFYEKLSLYSRTFKIALSALSFHKKTPEKEINRYKEDFMFFLKLRASVKRRYSDVVDFKAYEQQIQKLVDKHIESSEVVTITELVNIFDKAKFQEEVEKVVGEAAKADMIATRTARTINEKMEEDPAFYKKFSQMLKEAIKAYEEKRISEAEYLNKVKEISESIVNHTDATIPGDLQEHLIARAFYGVVYETLGKKAAERERSEKISAQAALGIDAIIRKNVLDNGKPKVDWQFKSDLLGRLQIEIGDFLIDEIRDSHQLDLSFEEVDGLVNQIIDIAKIRYK